MRIGKVTESCTTVLKPTKKYTRNLIQTTKAKAANLNAMYTKKAGFMGLPLKGYFLGLLVPVPFACIVGFVVGLVLATGKKVLEILKSKKLHNA